MNSKFNANLIVCMILGSVLAAPAEAGSSQPPGNGKIVAPAELPDKGIYKVFASRISKEREQEPVSEATQTVMATKNALAALESNNVKKALIDLDEAGTQLRFLLAKNPDLKPIPVFFQDDTALFQGSQADIKAITQKVRQLLDKQRTQEARRLLDTLANEIRIKVVSLPLGSYPAQIKSASELVTAGKAEEARSQLQNLLDSLVTDVEVYVLPIAVAEAKLSEARELEQQAKLTTAALQVACLKLFEQAAAQLELAEALGYGDKKQYQGLDRAIHAVRENLRTPRSKAEWDKLGAAFQDLKSTIMRSGK